MLNLYLTLHWWPQYSYLVYRYPRFFIMLVWFLHLSKEAISFLNRASLVLGICVRNLTGWARRDEPRRMFNWEPFYTLGQRNVDELEGLNLAPPVIWLGTIGCRNLYG